MALCWTTPDLVGPGDGQLPEQIGVDLVPRRRFRGIRFAIERLDPHPLHQRGNVQPPDLEAFLEQQALQHSVAREGEFHVQLVDAVHQLQVRVRHWAGLVVDAAPADPQHDGLSADAQLGRGIDHFLALGNRPAFPSAPDKKSFSSVSSPIFACRVFTSTIGSDSAFGASPNTPVAPLLDLDRVNVEILRQLDQRPLALDRSYSHFRLECRTVVPARSFCHGLLLARSIMLPLRGKSTYPSCSDFPNHL